MAVRFDDLIWREAVRGFSGRSLEVAHKRSRSMRLGHDLYEIDAALGEVLPKVPAAYGADAECDSMRSESH